MRRIFIAAAFVAAAATAALPIAAYAQRGGQSSEDDAAKKEKRDKEWGDKQAPLPALRNAGPCPYVKTLYDAARTIEFKTGKVSYADVGYTGEIENLSSGCEYKADQPIHVVIDALFEFGKGPQAQGSSHTYRYWVAVTDRNRDVIAKQYFDIPVSFPAGKDRVYHTEHLKQIVIPRGTATTSGANFEVLLGFDVSPEEAAFNRDGKRFRLLAGEQATAGNAARHK